jgi:hypothetical protein
MESNWDKSRARIGAVLNAVTPLPTAVSGIVLGYAQAGITLAQAHQVRLQLMAERKFFVDSHNKKWQRSYTLCEH